jgi:hypothetical protein
MFEPSLLNPEMLLLRFSLVVLEALLPQLTVLGMIQIRLFVLFSFFFHS